MAAAHMGKILKCTVGRWVGGAGSVIGIVTGYGLGGPGIESRWG